MRRTLFVAIAAVCWCVLAMPSAMAAQKIEWRDLTVPVEPTDDPYYGLSLSQRQHLDLLLSVDRLRRSGQPVPLADIDAQRAALAALTATGVDGMALVEKERAFLRKLELQRNTVRQEWHDRDVRIPGYLLPLEYEGALITEFILVPYAGACIHTPPPPANQMIVVRIRDGIEPMGLFTPVWVTGRIRVARSSQSVGLSDGQSEFAAGYALEAAEVVAYGP